MFGISIARKAAHIRQDMCKRNPTEVFKRMIDRWDDEALVKADEEAHARRLERMRERRPQAGESLIGVLIVLLIIMTMAAGLAPNAIKAAQSKNAAAAAAWAMQVANAEFSYGTYGGYVQPQYLTGVLGSALPACANPMLLPGGMVGTIANPAAPAMGYSFNFHGTGASAGCVGGPTTYSAYSMTVDPVNPLEGGQRHFFVCAGTGCDGQVHYRNATSVTDYAQETDPVWSTTTASSGGGGSSSSPAAPTVILTGQWSATPTTPYAAGQEVLYTNGSSVGIYANLTGSNSPALSNPAGDAMNWVQIGSYSIAPPSLTGSMTGVLLHGGSFYTCPLVGFNCSVVITSGTIPTDYYTFGTSFTMTQFTVTMSPQNGGSALSIYTQPLPNPSGPANLGCTIPAYGTTCTVNLSPVVLPAGSQMEIVVTPGLSLPASSLMWTIS